jgi:RNA polymerase sigma factor (sigma-70 family)
MAKSAEVDDPSELAEAARMKAHPPDAFGVPPLAKGQRRVDVEEELRRWYGLTDPQRLQALTDATRGVRDWSPEVFVHVSVQAYAEGNRRKLNLAFEAFAARATPLLLSQAWGSAENEEEDQVQEILLHTCRAIVTGTADYAEVNFADFAKKKAISLHRSRESRFEGAFDQVEPEPDSDPLEHVADRVPTPEARALLAQSVGKLTGRLREVFIQYHVLERTCEEIAEQYEVDESAVRLWVKKANAIVGLQGGRS